MKASKLALLCAAVIFACVSYRQIAGINFLVFNLTLQALFLWHLPNILKNRNYILASILALFSAMNVVINTSDLSIFAFVISHLILPGYAFSRQNSFLLNSAYSLFSFVAAVPIALTRLGEPKVSGTSTTGKNSAIAVAVILTLSLGFAFFLLYRTANPLFKSATDGIDLSWISFSWLLLVAVGLFIFKGLSANETSRSLSQKDAAALLPLVNTPLAPDQDRRIFRYTGAALFLLLNLFQVFVNGLDVHYLYIAKVLPDGITLSDFVHQAVAGMLALVTIALIIIIYLFAGWFNFDTTNALVRRLVLAWILQAQLMLFNTGMRNWWYIQSFQLTYLRIFVMITLLICSFALYFIWQKIQHKQSNWYFLNAMAKTGVFVFFALSFLNWDAIIARYNISHCKELKNLDVYYLCSLPGANSDLLAPLLSEKALSPEEKQVINRTLLDRYLAARFQHWPSWNYRAFKNEQTYLTINK